MYFGITSPYACLLVTSSRYLMKAIIILVPLLAFTWITGLFAVGDGGDVSVYLFVVANVLQVRGELLLYLYYF